MIAFNLLPHREALRKFKRDQFNAALVLALILGAITAFTIYGMLNAAIEAQRENIGVLEKEIKRYEGQIGEIKDLRTQIEALLARQKAVEDIQADRNLPVRLLAELAATVPQGVALTKLAQKDLDLILEGTAQSNENLSQFLDNLGKVPGWFAKPELSISSADLLAIAGKPQVKVYKFSIKVALLRSPSVSPTSAGPTAPAPSASAAASASSP